MGRCAEAVKGPVDFTGYWALAKHEQLDEFLRAAGFPWVVRKAAVKFGGSSIDVIAHTGSTLRVTSLNAKGSWTRTYDVDREVTQKNAEGTLCKTTSWWEGRVFRSRLEGSELGVLESWRYLRGASMAVRTSLRSAGGGPEAVMFWFFDRMETLQRHVARGGGASLLQKIETDQRHVERATRKDTQYIQNVLLDWQRWKSPADDFIHVASPPTGASRGSRQRRRPAPSPGSGSPRTLSPMSMSKSPSNDSLAALPAGLEMRSEAKSIHSDSRSRLADSELSAAALDRVARQAAALALPDESDGQPSPSHPAAAAAAAAAEGSAEGGKPPQVPKQLSRDITLSYPRGEGGSLPVEPASEGAAAAGRGGSLSPVDSLTFKPAGSSSSQAQPEAAAGPLGGHPALAPSAAGSDAATRGSVHQRNASVSSVGGTQRPVHYKSLSADSTRAGSTPGRGTPSRLTPAGQPPLSPTEQIMAFRLHEFDDGRGIASVVPVNTPNDTAEPQLLCMSPEQAEETAAKLRELETDMLLRRQEHRSGVSCGCLVISWSKDHLPDHLRVWEMTLT